MEQTIASPNSGRENRELFDKAWHPVVAAVISFLSTVWLKIQTGFWTLRDGFSTDIGRPLDIERISARLAVVRRAREEGRHNLPPITEEVPSGTQREVIAYFTNLRRRARKQVAEIAEKSRRMLDGMRLSDALAKLRDIPSACENKILRQVADSSKHFLYAAEREQKQKRYYEAFREKHGLDRVASYPRVFVPYFLSVPVLIVIIAVALARIIEVGGISAPLGWIASVAAASIIVPFVIGDVWVRSINHVGRFRRFSGLLGATTAIAVILGVAFYIDFHIASVLTNPETSNRDVLDAMMAAPFHVVATVADWKVFSLVALCGLSSMLLAYRSDDPYPGYGAVQRTYYVAREAREEESARLRRRANGLVDSAEAEIDTLARDFKNKVRAYTTSVEKSKQIPAALKDYDAELEDACNLVLDRYRVANMSARRLDAPMSFSEHICFSPYNETECDSLCESNGHVAELQDAIGELDNEVALARQKLRTLNVRMIDSISDPQTAEVDGAPNS